MNILKTIKNRINNNIKQNDNEAGFSLLEGVISIGIMAGVMTIGFGALNDEGGGITGIIDNAKQVQTASLAQTTMTNIIFYDIDMDDETNEESAVRDFNDENIKKGFTAFVERNDDCIAVQVVADNGSDTIEKSGKNCEALVEKLSKNAVKEDKSISENKSDKGMEFVNDSIPREVLEAVAYGNNE